MSTPPSPPTLPPLSGSATVNLPLDEAFAFFTGSMTAWWPAEYHIGAADMVATVVEPAVGGRWFERGDDGTECDWGRVLLWEPPNRLVLTWQVNGYWAFDPDPAHASEIEVRFTAEDAQTVVTLEHRHLGRLLDGAGLRDQIEQAGGGWASVLQKFAAVASSGPAAVTTPDGGPG